MVQELTKEPVGYQWALPENVNVPPDELKVRLDFYGQSIVMYVVEKGDCYHQDGERPGCCPCIAPGHTARLWDTPRKHPLVAAQAGRRAGGSVMAAAPSMASGLATRAVQTAAAL